MRRPDLSKAKALISFRKCCIVSIPFLFLLGLSLRLHSSAQDNLARFSKPKFLTFAELVELEKNDPPSATLAEKLKNLLTTPIVSNEAYLSGAKPKRPSSTELGTFLRAVQWNIERGINFDSIRIALSEPQKFDKVIAEKKD